MKATFFNFLIFTFFLATLSANAQNPVIHTCFSTDPAPMVYGDRVYVFTGHDEEGADFFWMNEWRLFSSADMVNWTDHGCPLAQGDLSWADDRAWAPQCIERNGKFYLYVPVHSRISRGMAIGVAVADKIEGPYKDPLGKPLFENGSWDHIDPTVMIDADGQAYLYWGNPRLYSVKLNEDMISLASEVKCDTTVRRYTEGPWIMKQRPATKEEQKAMKAKKIKKSYWGKYFMVYAAGGVPECIAYSVSDNPQGPWEYVGEVMPQSNDTQSFTNHSGTVTFKDHNYFFYHTGWLPGGGGFARSVSVEEFQWNPDGSFPTITAHKEGVKPIGTLNPYVRVEAETIANSKGVKSEWNKKHGVVFLSDIQNGDWTSVREVELKPSTSSITVRAASGLQGGTIEIHLGSERGQVIASVKVAPTGGWEEWEEFTAPVRLPADFNAQTSDLYFMYKGLKGCKLFNFDWWQLK
jgi:hypothetical protein